MASIYAGRRTAIGLGEEGTYGTPVARTTWRPAVSTSLGRTVNKPMRPHLLTGNTSAVQQTHLISSDEFGGDYEILGTYDNVGMMLKHALGTLVTTGAGPFTHTYDLADEPPTGLTIETVRGNGGTAEVGEGCKINTLTLSCNQGEVMRMMANIIGETSGGRVAAGSPSYAATQEFIDHHHFAALSWNGRTPFISSFTVTLNNALARRQFLGSKLTLEPKRSDYQVVEASVTVEVDDAIYGDLLSDPSGLLTIAATSGTKSFTITLGNAFLATATDPINTPGVFPVTLGFRGQAAGAAHQGLRIAVVNDNASGIAN